MSVRPREDRAGLAVAIVLIAFLCFTALDTGAKWLAALGLPALQLAFLRYAVNFALALAVFLPQEGPRVFVSNAPLIQISRALAIGGATCFNFLALQTLPLTVTTAIFFATPILVCLLSIPILGEQVGLRRLAAVATGFVGVLIIVQPGSTRFEPAMLYSLAALLSGSCYFILTRMIAGRDDNPTGQIYTSGLPMLALLPFVIGGWVWPTGVQWLPALALGALGMLGHSLVTIGHRYAEASTLAPLVYSQAVYASVFSWLVFAQPPDGWTALGTSVIAASGFYIWLRERQRRTAPA